MGGRKTSAALRASAILEPVDKTFLLDENRFRRRFGSGREAGGAAKTDHHAFLIKSAVSGGGLLNLAGRAAGRAADWTSRLGGAAAGGLAELGIKSPQRWVSAPPSAGRIEGIRKRMASPFYLSDADIAMGVERMGDPYKRLSLGLGALGVGAAGLYGGYRLLSDGGKGEDGSR